MPINVRSKRKPVVMNNTFASVNPVMPVLRGEDDSDVCQLLADTHDAFRVVKHPEQALSIFVSVRILLGLLPQFLGNFLVDLAANRPTAVFSNVPGPRTTQYLGGTQALQWASFTVPSRCSIGLGISALSYDGHVRMGAITDTAVSSNPERIVQNFAAAFERIRAAVEIADGENIDIV
jgi:hypothetical protein